MQIEEIISIMGTEQRVPISLTDKTHDTESFQPWLSSKLQKLDNQIIESDLLVRKLAMGETENLHQIMMALEKAKLQFSLVTEVRNKLLEGYKEVMRMQI